MFIRIAHIRTLLKVAVLALAFMLHALPSPAQALGNIQPQELGHLAPSPPMGWASWNHFFCDYDEKTIRAEADALVSTGMRDLGYKYVVIQECISRERDTQGNLIVDSVRFPGGMKALTDYIHKRGLKAGIYTDIGKHTCYPNPRYQGSFGHEEQDAQSFCQVGHRLRRNGLLQSRRSSHRKVCVRKDGCSDQGNWQTDGVLSMLLGQRVAVGVGTRQSTNVAHRVRHFA
jgi:hypothetical protein